MMDVVKINSFRETLEKLYWMETKLEFLRETMASFKIHNEQYKEVLTNISNDSSKHREILENIINDLEGIDLFWLRDKARHMDAKFDFNGLSEEEIMMSILDEEHKALKYYKKVYDETDKKFIEEIWKGDDSIRFFEQISFLIDEEDKHIGWLQSVQTGIKQIS